MQPTKAALTEFIRTHPGTDSGAIAEAFGSTIKRVSSSLSQLFARPRVEGAETLVRVQDKAGHGRGLKYVWYMIAPGADAPAGAEWPSLAGAAPKAAPAVPEAAAEAAAADPAAPLAFPPTPNRDALKALIQARPGITSPTIVELTGWDATAVAQYLYTMSKPGKKSPAVVERVRGGNGPDDRLFHHYLPEDLPSEIEAAKIRAIESARAVQQAEEDKRLRREARAQKKAAEAEAGHAAPPPPPATLVTTADPAGHLGEVITSFATQLAQLIVGQVVDRLSAAVALQMETALQVLPAKLFPESDPTAPASPKAEARPKKPKIVAVGVYPDRRHAIEQEFGGHFRLDFIGIDDSPRRLGEKLQGADHAFVITDHIKHPHKTTLEHSKVPYSYVDGIHALKDTLRALVAASVE